VPRAPARALIVVLEGVANADNVGGAFRNAQAFGANAVLMDSTTTDPLYRKAIRTSMGSSLVVPFARDDQWPTLIGALRSDAMTTVALTPRTDSTALDDVEPILRATRRVAWLIGNEGAGLSAPAMAAADLRVRIPIAARSDSLNASAALAIALYANTVAWR
jgi:tRNA G18 (ribose-2'-O)-methylase SpoU